MFNDKSVTTIFNKKNLIIKKIKYPFVAEYLLQKIEKLNLQEKKQVIRTWSRSSTIIPVMIGHTRYEKFQGRVFIYKLRFVKRAPIYWIKLND